MSAIIEFNKLHPKSFSRVNGFLLQTGFKLVGIYNSYDNTYVAVRYDNEKETQRHTLDIELVFEKLLGLKSGYKGLLIPTHKSLQLSKKTRGQIVVAFCNPDVAEYCLATMWAVEYGVKHGTPP